MSLEPTNIGLTHQLDLAVYTLWSSRQPLDHRSTSVAVAEQNITKLASCDKAVGVRFIQTALSVPCAMCFPNNPKVILTCKGGLFIIRWHYLTCHFVRDTSIRKMYGDPSFRSDWCTPTRPETQSTISTMAEISASDSSWDTRWCPPLLSWFINPINIHYIYIYIYITNKNLIVIGLTINLANYRVTPATARTTGAGHGRRPPWLRCSDAPRARRNPLARPAGNGYLSLVLQR